ncbi:MAG: NADH-quinone oxidoreductase subunit NuoK [Desulfobacteraceae bacterium]|nr:MAG: NADH-quinone oxidoreductase subunit NuoK [Desulfobacteraceae bacterium]
MTLVPYGHVIALAAIIFSLGLACVVGRRNLIMTLVGIEVMMNGAALAFLGAALRWQMMEGQVFVLFIIAVAAAEVSVGLALIVNGYRRSGSIDPDAFQRLKW